MSFLPFLDHIDPGQGGSAMVIPESPPWNSRQIPERHPCKQCNAVFDTYDGWFSHRFSEHPILRPMLVMGDVEVVTPRFTAHEPLPATSIRVVNTISCKVNGASIPLDKLGERLADKPRAFYAITLVGESGVETKYELSMEIATQEDMALVERDFAALANQGRLTVHVVNAFVQSAATATTARRLTDGLANYVFGVLGKDQRGETALTQEQGWAKLNEAHQSLNDIRRPLAQAVAAVIEFQMNVFNRETGLRPVPLLRSAMDWYRTAAAAQIQPTGMSQGTSSSTASRVPLDSATHELLSWVNLPGHVRLEEVRTIERRSRQATWLHEDRVKAQVLLAGTYQVAGDLALVREHARSFRHDPVFGSLAEALLG